MRPVIYAVVLIFLVASLPVRADEPDRAGCETRTPSPPVPAATLESMEPYLMGRQFVMGRDVPRDDAEAAKWFHRAAEGSPVMATMIAQSYDLVHPPEPRDLEKAIYWYERAAEGGEPFSLLVLGHMYRKGEDVSVDLEKAFAYFSRAAAAGHPAGDSMVGKMYYYGNGRTVNYRLARRHFLLAARCGDKWAMNHLGRIYRDGIGTERNPREALRWFTGATKGGLPFAAFAVAEMYRDGVLEASDREVKALSWFLIAVLGDYGDTDEARALYLEMSPDATGKAFEETRAMLNEFGLDGTALPALEQQIRAM